MAVVDSGPQFTARGRLCWESELSLLTKFLAVSGEPLGGQIDPFAAVLDHSADHLDAPAMALQNGERGVAIPFGGDNTKPNSHIVRLKHFGVADRAIPLNQGKDRRGRRQVVN